MPRIVPHINCDWAGQEVLRTLFGYEMSNRDNCETSHNLCITCAIESSYGMCAIVILEDVYHRVILWDVCSTVILWEVCYAVNLWDVCYKVVLWDVSNRVILWDMCYSHLMECVQ